MIMWKALNRSNDDDDEELKNCQLFECIIVIFYVCVCAANYSSLLSYLSTTHAACVEIDWIFLVTET